MAKAWPPSGSDNLMVDFLKFLKKQNMLSRSILQGPQEVVDEYMAYTKKRDEG